LTNHDERPISIVQGAYGRVTLNLDGRSLVAHAHAEMHVIFKLGAADAPFRIDANRVDVSDGQALVIPPWIPHARLEGDAAALQLVMWLSPAWIAAATDITRESLFPAAARVVTIGESTLAAAQRMAELVRDASNRNPDEIDGMVAELLTMTLRDAAAETGSLRSGVERRPADARIRRALDFMSECPLPKLSAEVAAEHVGLSRSRFFEQFKSCLGVTPHQYVDWIRIHKATQRLSETTMTLADISDELGFASQSHFSRFFSEHLGLPPGEFRRRAVHVVRQLAYTA
jgi:AraC family transcriptional regulator